MKISIQFTDIDPTHPFHKIGHRCNEKQTLQSLIADIKEQHDFVIKALSGKKADDLSLYTKDGTKLDQAAFTAMLQSGKDTTIHARPRRHMPLTAGVRGIKVHCLTSLYGSNNPTLGRKIEDLHGPALSHGLYRRGRRSGSTKSEASSTTLSPYASSPLSR